MKKVLSPILIGLTICSYAQDCEYVGIGTSNPTSTLEVKGAGTTSATSSFDVQNSAGTSMMYMRDDGRLGIGTTSPISTFDLRGSAVFNNGEGDNDFRIAGDTETNLLFIDASSDRVGIGTSAPAGTFEAQVDNNAFENFYIRNMSTGGSAATGLLIGNSGQLRITAYSSSYSPVAHWAGRSVIQSQGSSYGISFSTNSATGDIRWYTGGTGASNEHMRLDKDGQLGLGTTSPSSMLDIVGSGATSATYGLEVHNSTGSNNALIVRDDGKVGIGTNSPTAPLSIQTGVNEAIRIQTPGGATNRYRLFVGDGTGGFNNQEIYHVSANAAQRFHITSTEFLTLSDLGGVGIKKSAPTANKLESTIPGIFNSTSIDGINIYTSTTTNSALYIGTNGNATGRAKLLVDHTGQLVHLQGANTDIVLETGASGTTEAMRVQSDGDIELGTAGNVGIGDATPDHGLDINLSMGWQRKATAVSVNTAGDIIVGVTDNTSARTITLDTDDVIEGRVIIIKDEAGTAASANNITIATEGAELIDGASSVNITVNYGVIRLYSDGTNWFSF